LAAAPEEELTMAIAIFVLLALAVGAAIAYPLLPGRGPAETPVAVSDADIERAVRKFRRERKRGGLRCPTCGEGYAAGDRFCVHCGGALPQPQIAEGGQACPECGATLRDADVFCSKCGYRLAGEEVAS
jgi:DNA-directed RNA polymerase subunit RPC12/RpoP